MAFKYMSQSAKNIISKATSHNIKSSSIIDQIISPCSIATNKRSLYQSCWNVSWHRPACSFERSSVTEKLNDSDIKNQSTSISAVQNKFDNEYQEQNRMSLREQIKQWQDCEDTTRWLQRHYKKQQELTRSVYHLEDSVPSELKKNISSNKGANVFRQLCSKIKQRQLTPLHLQPQSTPKFNSAVRPYSPPARLATVVSLKYENNASISSNKAHVWRWDPQQRRHSCTWTAIGLRHLVKKSSCILLKPSATERRVFRGYGRQGSDQDDDCCKPQRTMPSCNPFCSLKKYQPKGKVAQLKILDCMPVLPPRFTDAPSLKRLKYRPEDPPRICFKPKSYCPPRADDGMNLTRKKLKKLVVGPCPCVETVLEEGKPLEKPPIERKVVPGPRCKPKPVKKYPPRADENLIITRLHLRRIPTGNYVARNKPLPHIPLPPLKKSPVVPIHCEPDPKPEPCYRADDNLIIRSKALPHLTPMKCPVVCQDPPEDVPLEALRKKTVVPIRHMRPCKRGCVKEETVVDFACGYRPRKKRLLPMVLKSKYNRLSVYQFAKKHLDEDGKRRYASTWAAKSARNVAVVVDVEGTKNE